MFIIICNTFHRLPRWKLWRSRQVLLNYYFLIRTLTTRISQPANRSRISYMKQIFLEILPLYAVLTTNLKIVSVRFLSRDQLVQSWNRLSRDEDQEQIIK